MRPGKLLFLWWLLQKRLLRKPMFLILLILIPILCFGYSTVAREDSGILTVALAQTGTDPFTANVIDDLASSSELIRFRVCSDPETAEQLVLQGQADAAWIFPEDLQRQISRFAADPRPANAFVQVLERESNVLMLLSREKLSGALYGLCAQRLYLHYLRENVPSSAGATDEQLLRYFNGAGTPRDLFIFTQADGTAAPESDLLTSPVRGLLGVIIVLAGISAAMYYCRDLQQGTFARVPVHLLPLAELGCIFTATFDLALVSSLSLVISGLSGSWLREFLIGSLYSLSVAGFSMVLRRLMGSVKGIGILLPLLITAMLVLCPVFFTLALPGDPQYLLPPTYYIYSAYNDIFSLYMLLYSAATVALYLLLHFIRKTP